MRGTTNPLYVLLTVAAALGFILPFSFTSVTRTNPPDPQTASSASALATPPTSANVAASKSAKVDPGNAAKLIYEFLGIDPEKTTCRGFSRADANYQIEFLVATIPDPKESRLSYLFDRNLDAIQRAVEASEHVLDRFDLPWLDGTSKATDSKDATGARAGPRHKHEPGVILFANKAKRSLLALFIVGETPTYGIHKPALEDALDQIARLSGWTKEGERPPCMPVPKPVTDSVEANERCNPVAPPSPNTIRLLAPTFSGSQESLEIALQNWLSTFDNKFDRQNRPSLRVISGSATAVDQAKFCHRFEITDPWQPKFHAAVLPVSITLEAFRRYVIERDPRAGAGRIALLTEANTAYGSSAKAEHWALRLPFPLHISQLRSATERARSARTPAVTDPLGLRKPLLPLQLEELNETNEIVPLFSQFEKATLELTLSNMMAEIDRERIRYLGIIATDVQDCVFLVREIRRHAPNTQVFSFLADLIYLRPELSVDLRGTMVVTPYPLFSPNQFWTYAFEGHKSRLQFPTWVTQGAYNATLALLGKTDRLQEYGFPFDWNIDRKRTNEQYRQPVIWLSVVGETDLWPVTVLPDLEGRYQYGDYAFRLPVAPGLKPNVVSFDLASSLNSRTTIIVLLALSAIGLVVGLVIFFDRLRATVRGRRGRGLVKRFGFFQTLARNWPGEAFGDAVFLDYRFRIRVYLLACCVSLLFIYAPFTWVSILPWWSKWQFAKLGMEVVWTNTFITPFIFIPVTVLILVPVVWLFFSLCDWTFWLIFPPKSKTRLEQKKEQEPKQPWIFGAAALVTLMVVAGVVLVGYGLLNSAEPYENVFLYMRAIDLQAGISPLLPLLLVGLAGFACGFSSLTRMKLLQRFHRRLEPPRSFLNFEPNPACSFAGIERHEAQVLYQLECRSLKLPGAYLLGGLVLSICIYLFMTRFIPTVEGWLFDYLFWISLVLVMIFLTLAFLRFCSSWVALRRLLRRFSLHSLFAFRTAAKDEKDQDRFPGLPRLNLTASSPNYHPIAYSVYQGRELVRLIKTRVEAAKLRPLVEASEFHLDAALRAKSAGNWRKALKHRCTTQILLGRASGLVSEMLEPLCTLRNAPAPETTPLATGLPTLEDQNRMIEQSELFLASRLAAFLHLILAHMQNLVAFVTSGMILLLLAIAYYPFQPRDQLLLFGWVLILSVVFVTIAIFVQMNRDSVLSVFTGSIPGKLELNRSFISRVLIHGLLPILALLNAQFPDAIRQFFSWLDVFQGGTR